MSENPFKVKAITKYYDFLYSDVPKFCPCKLEDIRADFKGKSEYLLHCYNFHPYGFGDLTIEVSDYL